LAPEIAPRAGDIAGIVMLGHRRDRPRHRARSAKAPLAHRPTRSPAWRTNGALSDGKILVSATGTSAMAIETDQYIKDGTPCLTVVSSITPSQEISTFHDASGATIATETQFLDPVAPYTITCGGHT
jgi:hypothetical protein